MYRIMPFNAWKGKKAYLYIHLEKAMAPHSKTLAWKIPWMEEPGRLQSMGSLRVRHDWATSLSLFTFMHWRRKWQPTPVFLPGESQGRGSPVAAIYGVTQSRTRLKWLSIAYIHQNVHSGYHRRVTLQMIFIFFLNTYSIISKFSTQVIIFIFLTS